PPNPFRGWPTQGSNRRHSAPCMLQRSPARHPESLGVRPARSRGLAPSLAIARDDSPSIIPIRVSCQADRGWESPRSQAPGDGRIGLGLGAGNRASVGNRGETSMSLKVNVDREEDGRWIAEIPDLPGVLVYCETQDDALARVKAISLRVLADRIEHGESFPGM